MRHGAEVECYKLGKEMLCRGERREPMWETSLRSLSFAFARFGAGVGGFGYAEERRP
jgi:hypothetical protein